VHAPPRLKRDNHYLPVCYQKGFTDSSGRVWVKFAGRGGPARRYPRSVGKQQSLYIRSRSGVEDDKFEHWFAREVENDFARLSRRVKREQDHLSNLTGRELGALGKFVASQVVRTLANKRCMEEQVGRALGANAFVAELGKQMREILRSWETSLPGFHFYTSLAYVQERFITGDDPVLVAQGHDNRIWTPADSPRQAITSLQELLNSPRVSFRVALSPYVCVFLRARGGGEAHLPPQTMDAPEVRSFNACIRGQCKLFTLAGDEGSLAQRARARGPALLCL
jgi:Protein of unknown function (DUF4238)